MRHKGLEPSVITYNATICASDEAKLSVNALELREERGQKGLELDVITYSVTSSAYQRSSSRRGAHVHAA